MKILVAGASGGIGSEVVRLLSATGAVLGAHYHRTVPANAGDRIKPFKADLSKPAAAAKLVADFARWAGGIDALIQLNGGAHPADIDSATPRQWQADLDLNLTAPFFLAREAMKRMPPSGGRIVLCGTASSAHGGGSRTMAYGAAKAGLECVTKGLAREGAPRNILVNAVCPGFIDTAFHTRHAGRTAAELKKRAALVPLGRAGTPLEVAGLIAFLMSDHAGYITGQCIAISGGDWL